MPNQSQKLQLPSIEKLPVIAKQINEELTHAKELHKHIEKIDVQNHTFDYLEIKRIVRITTTQYDNFKQLNEQLQDWKTNKTLPGTQQKELECLEDKIKQLNLLDLQILLKAHEILEDTVGNNLLEENDFKLGLEAFIERKKIKGKKPSN